MSNKENSNSVDEAIKSLRDAEFSVFPAPVRSSSKIITDNNRVRIILDILRLQRPHQPITSSNVSENQNISRLDKSVQDDLPPLASKK